MVPTGVTEPKAPAPPVKAPPTRPKKKAMPKPSESSRRGQRGVLAQGGEVVLLTV